MISIVHIREWASARAREGRAEAPGNAAAQQTYLVPKPNAAPSTVTPEPDPVLLLATGLIGSAGVSIRKGRVGTA